MCDLRLPLVEDMWIHWGQCHPLEDLATLCHKKCLLKSHLVSIYIMEQECDIWRTYLNLTINH
jgi:hypothetical protein